jgi:hypothetical protein
MAQLFTVITPKGTSSIFRKRIGKDATNGISYEVLGNIRVSSTGVLAVDRPKVTENFVNGQVLKYYAKALGHRPAPPHLADVRSDQGLYNVEPDEVTLMAGTARTSRIVMAMPAWVKRVEWRPPMEHHS